SGTVEIISQTGFAANFLFNSPSITDVAWAEDFNVTQLNTTVEAITIQAVSALFTGGFTATTFSDIEVKIFSDNSGFPGSEIHSETVAGPFFIDNFFSVGITPLNVRLSAAPSLAPGTYWISLTSDSGNNSGIFSYFADPISPLQGNPMRIKSSNCPEPEFGNCGGIATNYNLLTEIELCVSAAPVPTMGQWGLIIFGLLILCFGTVAIKKALPEVEFAK
ncbi:MAG: hypothetical protein AAF598_17470, partial [Bacteroidota bacterium]